MDRVAVFVDAGYLFAQGSIALAGEKLQRGALHLNHEPALAALESFSRQASGLPLLRIYWYDGTSTGPTPQQLALAYRPSVKLRLGFVNSAGSQKGVDSLIVTDMITLARNRAMSDAVLLSGDEDLRVGVQQARELGVRVHLLGIEPSRKSQSQFLLQEADTTHEWKAVDLQPFLDLRALNTRPDESADRSAEPLMEADVNLELEEAVRSLVESLQADEREAVRTEIQQSPAIPKDLDRRLLIGASSRLGRELSGVEKKLLRQSLKSALQEIS